MISLGPVAPILRMFDVAAAKRFYLEYLGCALDWEDGEGERAASPRRGRRGRRGTASPPGR